jgi:putative ABC transport system ATP-binding protein
MQFKMSAAMLLNPNPREGPVNSVPAIQIANLTVQLAGRIILSGFSLRLQQGRKKTLVGPSGSGKSTILRCVLGFIQPAEGEVFIEGQTLTPQSAWSLRTRMAYVPQEPDLGSGTVREILERPFSFRTNQHLRCHPDAIAALFERLLLPPHLLDKPVSFLSGGEKQRIALISALLLKRPILLLDEASSALDKAAKQAVLELLAADAQLSILSVSHDDEWIACSDSVIDLSSIIPEGQHGHY